MPSPDYVDSAGYEYYVDPIGNVWKVDPKTNKASFVGRASSRGEAIQLIKSKTGVGNTVISSSPSSGGTPSSHTSSTQSTQPPHNITLTPEQAAEKLVEAVMGSIGYAKRERIGAGVYKFVTSSGTTIIVDVNTHKITYTTADGKTRTVTYNPQKAQQKVHQIQQEIEQYNKDVEQLNKQIEAFNKKYGGRELTPEEYKKALAEQKQLEQRIEELKQKYKKVVLDVPKIRSYSTIVQIDTNLDKLVPIQSDYDKLTKKQEKIIKQLQSAEKEVNDAFSNDLTSITIRREALQHYYDALLEYNRLQQEWENFGKKYGIPEVVVTSKHSEILSDIALTDIKNMLKNIPDVYNEIKASNIKGWKATALGEWWYTTKELWGNDKDIAAPATAAFATLFRRSNGFRDPTAEKAVSFITSWLELEGAAKVGGFMISRLAGLFTESRAVSSGANLNIEVLGKTQTAIKLRDIKSPYLQKFANKINKILIGMTKRTIVFNEERVAGYIRGFTNKGDNYEVLVKPLKNGFIKLTLKQKGKEETAIINIKRVENSVLYKGITSKGKVIEGVESTGGIFKGVSRDPRAFEKSILERISTKSKNLNGVPKGAVQSIIAYNKFLEKISKKIEGIQKLGGIGILSLSRLKTIPFESRSSQYPRTVPIHPINVRLPSKTNLRPNLSIKPMGGITPISKISQKIGTQQKQITISITTIQHLKNKLQNPITPTPHPPKPPKPKLLPFSLKPSSSWFLLPTPYSLQSFIKKFKKKKVWNIIPSLMRLGKVKIRTPYDVKDLTLGGVVLRKYNKSRKTKKKK